MFKKKRILVCLFFICAFFSINIYADRPVVLVTGASKKLGKNIATLLADKDYCVYGGTRFPEKALKDGSENTSLHFIKMDITDPLSISQTVQSVIEAEGRLDILVNASGFFEVAPFELMPLDRARQLFEVNFFGPCLLMQEVLPIMREQGGGKIIHITSTSAFDPAIAVDYYSASQHALEALTESIAYYASEWNINMVLVEPGPVQMDADHMQPHKLNKNPVYNDFLRRVQLFYTKRLEIGQSPREVAEVVESIVVDPNPNLRYQTNQAAINRAQSRLKDVSGKRNLTVKQMFAKKFFQQDMSSTESDWE